MQTQALFHIFEAGTKQVIAMEVMLLFVGKGFLNFY